MIKNKTAVPSLRQKILILYSGGSALDSKIVAWSLFDATEKEKMVTGDSDVPPYESVFDAMKDGWRVIQISPIQSFHPGTEYSTGYLKFEHVLEKIASTDG